MIYFEIKNKNFEILASNIQQSQSWNLFKNDKNITLRSKGIRSGFKDFGDISVWLIVENEKDLLSSNKLFNRAMETYRYVSSDFFKYYLHKIRAHSHTLRSIQGKMKQKIDGVIKKDDFRAQNYSESKKQVSEKIKNNTEKTADLICHLNKRVAEIDAHIEGFDILYMGDEPEVNIEKVNIKKVLQNVLAPFLHDFREKSVEVNFHISDEHADKNRISLDYKLFNLALVNFFDNAVKYSKPDSDITITFNIEDGKYQLKISMMSLRIEKDELQKIFEEGYSGENAIEESGDGIGMHVMRKALRLINIDIGVEPDYSVAETIEGKKFAKNVFTIRNYYEV